MSDVLLTNTNQCSPQAEVINPTRIRLEASTHCQLKCPTCETATGELYKHVALGFLRYDNFVKLIDENPQLEEIELSNFGEIFLNPQLPKIMEYAHEKGISLSAENGANLVTVRDSTLEAIVKYGFRRIRCSIDGASQETYEQYRVRGNFDQVMKNIERINYFKKEYNSEYPILTWQFVVFGHNEHEIVKAREMAAERNMYFMTKLNWDENWSPVRDKEMVRKEMDVGVASRSEFRELHGSSYNEFVCDQLWDNPQLNFDGTVWGCCRNNWKAFEGNIFDDGLENALNSEQLSYTRQMLVGEADPRDDIPCMKCSVYKNMVKEGRHLDRKNVKERRTKYFGSSSQKSLMEEN